MNSSESVRTMSLFSSIVIILSAVRRTLVPTVVVRSPLSSSLSLCLPSVLFGLCLNGVCLHVRAFPFCSGLSPVPGLLRTKISSSSASELFCPRSARDLGHRMDLVSQRRCQGRGLVLVPSSDGLRLGPGEVSLQNLVEKEQSTDPRTESFVDSLFWWTQGTHTKTGTACVVSTREVREDCHNSSRSSRTS